MATVTLSELWIHRADDPSTYLTFDGGQAGYGTAVAGEVRTYANGRRRAVSTPGTAKALPVDLPHVDRDDFWTLQDWVAEGALLILRDVFGRVEWGRIFAIEGDDPREPTVDVGFTFEIVSHDEGV